MKNALLFLAAVTLAGAAGYVLKDYLAVDRQPDNPVLGQPRPEFAIEGLDGKMHNIREWDGKVILLNFWATWCPPCKKEIPDFIAAQKALEGQNFQVIGVAVDNIPAVKEFAAKMGINYPIMAVQDEAVELSRRYGNTRGGLPYSVLIDKNGKIIYTITGVLSKKRLFSWLSPLGIQPD